MDKVELVHILETGVVEFSDLRAGMANEYDGEPSKVIPAFTREEVHTMCRGAFEGREGPVDPNSWLGLIALISMMEFR